ncbi:YuzD family protein [Priestia endophytica]|jgi:disulfide oxidoreductase YuzD|uniref:Disulfide oxidoreductase n=1 Tax=Priestia endophytica TaxID=135735 RepID=A0AAX1Q702_9BACI|nr:YuzD family protein [Priestia endophytica]RAS74696.1 disulfide oxidoreductase [Priestia endophytica]RAS88039.1 disulfide oxidoreductase [Priestia endophytica]
MSQKAVVNICVYGAEVICASCVNAPTSKDTFEWLKAALSRKYGQHCFDFIYVDINEQQSDREQTDMCKRILEEEFFYPLVTINGEIAGEGHIQLSHLHQKLQHLV